MTFEATSDGVCANCGNTTVPPKDRGGQGKRGPRHKPAAPEVPPSIQAMKELAARCINGDRDRIEEALLDHITRMDVAVRTMGDDRKAMRVPLLEVEEALASIGAVLKSMHGAFTAEFEAIAAKKRVEEAARQARDESQREAGKRRAKEASTGTKTGPRRRSLADLMGQQGPRKQREMSNKAGKVSVRFANLELD